MSMEKWMEAYTEALEKPEFQEFLARAREDVLDLPEEAQREYESNPELVMRAFYADQDAKKDPYEKLRKRVRGGDSAAAVELASILYGNLHRDK